MIEIGQKVQFDPFKDAYGFGSNDNKGKTVIGTVIYTNKPNRWFLVEYNCGGATLRTSFLFCDIGKAVTVCKE